MNSQTKKVLLAIHKAIHEGGRGLRIDSVPHPIKYGMNRCRFITYKGMTVIQQDPKHRTALGNRAHSGERISRIMRPGKHWGYIAGIDNPELILPD